MFRFALIPLLLILSHHYSSAQGSINTLAEAEEKLSVLLTELTVNPTRDNNSRFADALKEVLGKEGAFDYPFEQLHNLGSLKSDDGVIRIFTWNLPLAVGTHLFNGFLMVKKPDSYEVFQLTDSRSSIETPQTAILPPSKWFGSLYYHLHQVRHKGTTYYNLLGVSFKDVLSTQRVIEVVWIDHLGEPRFGKPIFSVRRQKLSRIIFEYSARSDMTLRYSNEARMIVFDHLVPMRPGMEGLFQFYGPDFTHDGFSFEGGEWHFQQNIDVRNPRPVRARRSVEAPEANPEPGFLYQR